jgi:hypothetical protein
MPVAASLRHPAQPGARPGPYYGLARLARNRGRTDLPCAGRARIQIAPRTYWAQLSAGPSRRALWDAAITEILAGIYERGPDGRRPPESLDGSVKMWAYLQRQGIPAAKRTVERIMRANQ